jgi:hypothetical protein
MTVSMTDPVVVNKLPWQATAPGRSVACIFQLRPVTSPGFASRSHKKETANDAGKSVVRQTKNKPQRRW